MSGTFAVLALLLSLPATAPGQTATHSTATLSDGTSFSGTLTGATADWQLTFDEEGQPRTITAADLVAWGTPAKPGRGMQLLLADGGLLVADLVGANTDRLVADSRLFGEMLLPLECLAGILFHPPADAARRDRLAARLRATAGRSDRLILENGDVLTGTVLGLSATEVELESSVGKVKLDTFQIAALAFDPTLALRPKLNQLHALVGLDDGSYLPATALKLQDAKAEIKRTDGDTVSTAASHIVYLQPMGGQAVYLSDLKPASYRHIPYLSLPWDYQLDRNVQQTHLRAGGRMYFKGVGMHSASRLSFSLDGQPRQFAAELAIDSATGGRGSVVFRVFADTTQIYASPIVRGDSPVLPISVEIPADARVLSLLVDFAEQGDTQDHANWLNARLTPR